LNGLIAPTTPIGRRSVKASFPSPACAASIGTISPASLPRFDCGERVGRHRTSSLHARGFQGLPCFVGDQPRSLFVAPAERTGDAHEDLGPLVRRQRFAHGELSGVDGSARLVGAGFCHAADDVAGIGRAHLEPVARLDPLAPDEQLLFVGLSDHGASLDRYA